MEYNSNISTFHSSSDATQIKRNLVGIILVSIAVVMGFFAIKLGNLLIIAGFLVLPVALMLMNRPEFTFALAVILDSSSIDIPGVSYTSLGVLAKLLLVGTFTLSIAMGQRMWHGDKLSEKKPIILFMGIIVMLMAVRGSGLRMLGSSTWGGMMYINLIIGLLVFLALNGLSVEKRHIRWIIWGSLIAGGIGCMFSYQGWAAKMEMQPDVQTARLRYLIPLYTVLFPVVFAIRTRVVFIRLLLIMICFAMVALTGFRSRLVAYLMVCIGFGFFMSRHRMRYILVAIAIGLTGWVLAVLLAPHLPLGMQRAVSFVPGVNVGREVAMNAADSIAWRFEIWRFCWERVPDYLWIGRGSAFNVFEASANLSSEDIAIFSPWFAFETRSYHSGPLSLLLDYGLIGLLTGCWIMFLLFKRFWKASLELRWIDSFESRYVLFLCVYFLWSIFAYYFVYGDIRGFATLLANAAIIMVLYGSVKKIDDTHDGLVSHTDRDSQLVHNTP